MMSYSKHRDRAVFKKLEFLSLRSFEIILSILLITLATIRCMPQPTATQTIMPTSTGDCFPASVFTAQDMRARVDCHPDDYKLKITDDTVVLFAFPDPVMDWVGPVFVIHIPSVSEVVLDTEGSILFEDHKTPDGRQAIEGVLSNQELLTSILERAKEIENKNTP